ncbi:uncharacterized, partial [Tachysurus ichikawai]
SSLPSSSRFSHTCLRSSSFPLPDMLIAPTAKIRTRFLFFPKIQLSHGSDCHRSDAKHGRLVVKALGFQTSTRVRLMAGWAASHPTLLSFSFQKPQNIERDVANVNRNPRD